MSGRQRAGATWISGRHRPLPPRGDSTTLSDRKISALARQGKGDPMELLVGDMFRNGARAVPTRVAAAMDDDTLTFEQLDHRSNQVRHALAARGVGRGDRVVLWSATSLDSVPVFAALAKAGGIF